jgi:formate dehydrogenase iron-sulfur subunit
MLGRRRFLKTAALGVSALAVDAAAPARAAVSMPEELGRQHAGDPAVLVDLTRCVGCGSCVAACKIEHDLPWRDDQPALGREAALASSNLSVVRTATAEGRTRSVKMQCMHCLDPACASACFVRALEKTDEGPIVYNGDRCVGCRYCLVACPFGVPTFEWDETFGRVQKCDLCWSRTSAGRPAACTSACPTGAATFGFRGELLAEAWRRIDADDRYVRHVYGETEVGGTSWMYVSDVPFEALGFATDLPDEPLPDYTWEITRLIPPVAVGLGAALITLWRRRMRVLAEREGGGEP